MRDECDHGQLRRSCEICELQSTVNEQQGIIGALKRKLSLAEAERDALRHRIGSAPVVEMSLDERGCQTISCDFEEGKRVRLVVEDGE